MTTYDDVEHFLEGILEGLKARKQIAPLREKISVLEKENSDLQNDNKILSADNDKLSADLKMSEEKFAAYKKENADWKKKFESAEAENKFYRENYQELDEIYKIYLTLEEDMRSDLAGIFGKGETVTGFFSGAVQESHLEPFWDYISRRSNSPDFENLCKIFDFCFDNFNKGFNQPTYTRLNVEQGIYFDDEFMRRTPHSPQMGNVKRVLLQGYKYRVGNVVKPSIVELI